MYCKFNDSDFKFDSGDIDFDSNSDSSGIGCDLNSESRVSFYVFQFWHKHLQRSFVSQYMQQTVFHNGNQFTLYAEISKAVSLSKKS